MKLKRKRLIWIGIIVLVIAVVAIVIVSSGKKKDQKQATLKVERKNIVEKALAIGTLGPENEIAIKSKISGVVSKLFIDAGSFVNAGDPMLEIRPDPTPIELAEARRNVEMESIALENSRRDYERAKQLKDKGFTSDKEYEISQKQFDQAKVRLEMTQERLALLEKGKVKFADSNIESIVKSPINGFVLEKMINVGDPIVPLTS